MKIRRKSPTHVIASEYILMGQDNCDWGRCWRKRFCVEIPYERGKGFQIYWPEQFVN